MSTSVIATPATTAHLQVDRTFAALAQQPGFLSRAAQAKLSHDIVDALHDRRPFVAEAPTGTGKTVAYLVGALTGAQGQRVVVATATKALQSQLIDNDLPRLIAAGLLTTAEVALAKGRGNYFCVRAAEDSVAGGVQLAFPDLAPVSVANADEVDRMLTDFQRGHWDGDFDHYAVQPEAVDRVRATAETCGGRQCPSWHVCPFYRARAKLASARLVVANHDLVLIDLEQDASGVEPVLGPDRYVAVFDEAHHLPAKAIERGTREAALTELQHRLLRLRNFTTAVWKHATLATVLESRSFGREVFNPDPVRATLATLVTMLAQQQVLEESGQYRYPRGTVPADLRLAVSQVQRACTPLVTALAGALDVLRKLDVGHDRRLTKDLAEALYSAAKVNSVLATTLEGLEAFAGTRRAVRWLYRKGEVVSLHSCPLEGADVLRPLLWERDRANGTVLVSATLRDVAGFARFTQAAGIPAGAQYTVMPYIFPYERSTLRVAGMKASPKLAERPQFYAELRQKLPTVIAPDEAALVVFPSWAMFKEFRSVLEQAFGTDHVLAQGQAPVAHLVSQHKARVDLGLGSILAGVATLAEGLDLPGDYCTHVVVLALPFAVPTSPVEQEVAELLGPRYFTERSLPDATVRLTQVVGRLLRRETDVGRITVFDNRLGVTAYGRKMLAALPPFTKVIDQVAA